LVHLFGWGHVQNDNIPKQKGKPKQFAFEITQAMATHPVVIADRNNHQRRERKQLMEDIFPVIAETQFVALHYVHEPKAELLPAIQEVTRKRVLERGDNHQTIRAGSKNKHEIVGIMDGFLHRFEGVDIERDPDMHFQHVIDLDVCASSRQNLETVVTALHAAYPRVIPTMPTSEELDAAIDAAISNYEVKEDLSKGYSTHKPNKQKNPPVAVAQQKAGPVTTPAMLARKIEYFSISVPTSEITSTLKSLFTNTSPETARLYNQLHNSRRIQAAFHVTLIHRAASKDNTEIWDRYAKQYIDVLTANPVNDPITTPPKLGPVRVRLERLVWDNRIMAFVVRILPAEGESEGAADSTFPCANTIPHITVGTASPDVKPKESNDLLQRWHEVGSGGETGIFEAEVPGVKLVDGSVGVVMMRGKY
jgi:tRNA ligase